MRCKGGYIIKVDIQYWILDNKEKQFYKHTHKMHTHTHTLSPFPEALKNVFICPSCTYKKQKAKLNGQRYFPIKNVIQNTVKAFYRKIIYLHVWMNEWINNTVTSKLVCV